jgi:enoyl-CoA hydratase/carnithine racemase
MTETTPVRIIEETPAYWRAVFDRPPFNMVDAAVFEALQDLLGRMDASPSLRVVGFESAVPEFYLAHFDLTGKTGNITTAVGPSGLPILMDTFVRRPPEGLARRVPDAHRETGGTVALPRVVRELALQGPASGPS